MVVVPAMSPVTVPEGSTVAVEELVLLHTPPFVISLNGIVAPPSHTVAAPVIAAGVVGNGFTVTTLVAARLPQLLE